MPDKTIIPRRDTAPGYTTDVVFNEEEIARLAAIARWRCPTERVATRLQEAAAAVGRRQYILAAAASPNEQREALKQAAKLFEQAFDAMRRLDAQSLTRLVDACYIGPLPPANEALSDDVAKKMAGGRRAAHARIKRLVTEIDWLAQHLVVAARRVEVSRGGAHNPLMAFARARFEAVFDELAAGREHRARFVNLALNMLLAAPEERSPDEII
jgi:hypothetical protein